jgi:hypothetical protein
MWTVLICILIAIIVIFTIYSCSTRWRWRCKQKRDFHYDEPQPCRENLGNKKENLDRLRVVAPNTYRYMMDRTNKIGFSEGEGYGSYADIPTILDEIANPDLIRNAGKHPTFQDNIPSETDHYVDRDIDQLR